jgi:hypothetical protein
MLYVGCVHAACQMGVRVCGYRMLQHNGSLGFTLLVWGCRPLIQAVTLKK